MGRPLESFEFLNRGWDVRLLEGLSLRRVFVMFGLDVFMLGVVTAIVIFDAVRLHRFDWSMAGLFLLFILSVFRFGRLIYRHLER